MQSKYCLWFSYIAIFGASPASILITQRGRTLKMKTTVLRFLSQWRNSGRVLLATCWLFGTLLGFSSALLAKNALASLMRGFIFGSVSIVGVLAVSVLPIILSAFAVYLSETWLLYGLGFIKAFCFCFCATGLCLLMGAGSWLMQLLLLFSDCLTIPALYFYHYCILSRPLNRARLSFVCLLVCCCVGMVDYCIIAPFVQRVLL